MEVVAENSEATLAFRELAANMLRLIAGQQGVDLYGPMLRCVDAFDPKGGAISVADFTPRSDDPDQATNMIIRGALLMVASMMVSMDIEDEEYQRGLSEMSRGVVQLNARVREEKIRGWRR